MAPSFNRSGVVVESFPPSADLVFRTGVAGFLCPAVVPPGPSTAALPALPLALLFTSWHDFADAFRDGPYWRADTWLPDELLWASVQGFFGNGGQRCWVVLYDPTATGNQLDALDIGVGALADIDDVDLVCAPSLMGAAWQATRLALLQQLIQSAALRRDDWFLILDAPPLEQDLVPWLAGLRAAPSGRPEDVAVYHPWLMPGGDVELPPGAVEAAPVPPSGHVAGIFARTDQQTGVHKAPANEAIDGVVDVIADVDDVAGANPIRALPGRGIRVWGARTLAVPASSLDPNAYIGVRRLILTLDRWLVRALEWTVFKTNGFRTWVRIHRELNRQLTGLFEQGAFQGRTPDEAFYVKCDEENNPADICAAGKLQVDIGVAPAVPNEFIKIRLVRSADGITVA